MSLAIGLCALCVVLALLTGKQFKMSQEFDALKAQIVDTVAVQATAVTAIQSLVTQLAAAVASSADSVELVQLTRELKEASDALRVTIPAPAAG